MQGEGSRYEALGHCPICLGPTTFLSQGGYFRDNLICLNCGSIPRERALALILGEVRPNWRSLRIHESSPVDRGISAKMKAECPGYVETQLFPDQPLGTVVDGVRNENLERQTFEDEAFDICVSLDVLEHVNDPNTVLAETERTLVRGGICIFTTPTYKYNVSTERRSEYRDDGTIDFMGNEPEYHGNPVSDAGSLVTFHYGYDFPEWIGASCGFDTRVLRFHDQYHGILGDFTEVYICTKRP